MFRNVLTVLQGTLGAQAIGIILLPVLARLFSSRDFGIYELFRSMLAMLLVGASWRYELALLTCDESRLRTVLRLCLLTAIATGAFVVCIWLALCVTAGSWLGDNVYLVGLLPLGLFAGGIAQVLGNLPIRRREFRVAARAKIVQTLVYGVAALSLGFGWPFFGLGLILADVLGRLAVALLLSRWWSRQQDGKLQEPLACGRRITFRELKQEAYQHRDLPLMLLPGSLVSTMASSLTPFVIYSAFSLEVTGQYSIVNRGLVVPVGMLAYAISQVFTSEFAANLREQGVPSNELFRSVLAKLFAIAVIPAGLIFLAGPAIVRVCLGDEWALAGQFAQVSSLQVLIVFVASPVNMVIVLCGRQRVQLVWQILQFAGICGVWLAIDRLHLSPIEAYQSYVLFTVIIYAVYLWAADRVTRSMALLPRFVASTQTVY